MTADPERYFTKDWMVIAAIVMGLVSASAGAWLVAMAEPTMPLVTLLGVMGFVTSVLMFALAWWTKRTPIVQVWPDRVVVRAAMFAAERAEPWADVTSFEEKEGVWRLVTQRGPLVIPLGALSDADAAQLRASIARLCPPS